MKPTTILGRMPGVNVEYDSREGRTRKWFDDAYQARRFYTQKFKAGKNPRVIGQR